MVLTAITRQAVNLLTTKPLYANYALSVQEWERIGLLIRWLSVCLYSVSSSCFECWLITGIQQLFRDATNQMSATTSVTLSWSMYIYAVLTTRIHGLHAEAINANNGELVAAANAMLAKLRKYIDQSTSESEYYYFGAGMSFTCL